MKRIAQVATMVAIFVGASFSAMAAPIKKAESTDADFVKKAASGGMLEVKLGEYAVAHAGEESVKKFGQRMVDDHSKANKELMTLAAKKGYAVPKEMDKKCEACYNKLTKFKGTEFDKEYMRDMLEDHEKDIAEFEDGSKYLGDPDLQAWAKKTLPTLKEHLKLAKEVHAKIEKR